MRIFHAPGASGARGPSRLAVVRAEGEQAGPVGESSESETDAALVEALSARAPGAVARLYDRYGQEISKLVLRLLGPDADVEDVVQEIFIAALGSIRRLRDPALLGRWLCGIAVRSVKGHVRRKRRKRWLTFLPSEDLPEPLIESDDAHREAVRQLFALLDELPADERIALVLHRIEGMSLSESAAAARTSLATFKRRLARADARFFAGAKERPALAAWLEEKEDQPC